MKLSSSQRVGGHYLLTEKIGKGGMGDVYLALDERLDRPVAIKQLKLDAGEAREASILRFKQEARAVAKLNHPRIVSLYDIVTDADEFYMVMEYVKGRNLQEILQQQGPLPIELAVQIGIQLCEALKQAHAQGIVHRDIKPANVLVTLENDIKLTDFGIAQLNQPQDLRMTQAGTMLGSFLYASPEQLVNASEVDARTDIYAVGGTLYELFTGRTVYEADHPGKLIQKVFMEKPQPPQQLNALLSDELGEIVLRCLDKDPALRYQSVADLLANLCQASGQAQPGRSGELVLATAPALRDTRNTTLPGRLGLLKLTPDKHPTQSLRRHLQGQHGWLRLFLQAYQGVFAHQSFAQAKQQIKQPDLQGKTFSGILSFQDCYVFVKQGLICGAFHSAEQLLDDAALERLSEQMPMQMSYALEPELVLCVTSLVSGTGTAIQEQLDSRVVNLYSVVQDLDSELEQFTGYVIAQTWRGDEAQPDHAVYLYHQGKAAFQFLIDAQGQLQSLAPALAELLDQGPCCLSLYMPTQQMLSTVLYDFLCLAQLRPGYLDPQDSTRDSLLAMGESAVSEWMRSSLYEDLRKNSQLQILGRDAQAFPESLCEALARRPEYRMAAWTLNELLIQLHSQGQLGAFAPLAQALASIETIKTYQSLAAAQRQLTYTLTASLPGQRDPALLWQLGKGEAEELDDLQAHTKALMYQSLNRGEAGIRALFYVSTTGFEARSLALYSKTIEKIGIFNKQKGFVKCRGKEGFHWFLVDIQGETPRLIAPGLL